ncbi:MAG TPA: GDP-mannose 4,6-dehydratase [Chloroflexi bacterium]|jgi:GDP-4-dehydro-6-deoxy-D-mannose reductase|nr:GDP-mannose 4,6-dehydratase [Chloroflexota bacterium]
MTRTVLITGATGFSGSFLMEYYASAGWGVVGTHLGAPEYSPDQTLGNISLRSIDLRDCQAVRDLFLEVRPDLVVHLAAQSSVSMSWERPMQTLTDNATMQYAVLEAVLESNRGARIITIGSADEYGCVAPDENPVSEEHELLPASPYGLSKVVQDLMARQYWEIHGLDVVRTRPFQQAGPRRADKFVAGSFARQVSEIAVGVRERVIHVGNIDLERDFVDVRDVARAYALLAERGQAGEVYNIATGVPRTLRDMLELMLKDSGVSAEIREDPSRRRLQEAPLLTGDASKLRSTTGWTPEVSFEQSVLDTLGYWRRRVQEEQSIPAHG